MADKTNSDQFHFTRETTNQKNPGAKPNVTMLSPEGAALASVSAPSDAYSVRTRSTPAIKEQK
jgi:hypothetical protein